MKEISLGSSVEEIGSGAFALCAITEIIIPESVKSIGRGAFGACSDLKKLTIEDGETQLSLDYNYYHMSSGPFDQNVVEGMFYDCPLETVYVGRNFDVYSHAGMAFKDIETITDAVIGNNVTVMDGNMFRNCTNLTNLTIGSSVAEISESALDGCSNIKEIHTYNQIPPVIKTFNPDCFSNSTFIDAIVYVPKGSLSVYQNADVWKKFWNLQETETSGIFNVNNERPQNIWVENGNIIENCHVVGGSVVGMVRYIGGIAGRNTGTIRACSTSTTVTLTFEGTGVKNSGGIVGENGGTILACYATGSITGSAASKGAISGERTGISSEHIACYWSGDTEKGVGSGLDTTTKVAGDVTWETAMNTMNTALDGSGYRWIENTGENKEDHPLIITNE